MRLKKVPAPGRSHQRAGEFRNYPHSSIPFRFCKLHGCLIVDRFPDGCPFASADPARSLLEMKDRAYAHLDPNDPRLSESVALMRQYNVCWDCQNRLYADPAIRRLRQAAQCPAEPEAEGACGACSGKKNGRIGKGPFYV